jgi:hypothetical protein
VHEYSRRQHVEHIVEASRPYRRQQRVAVPQQVEIPDPGVIGAAPLRAGGLLQGCRVPVRLVKRKTCAQEMMSQYDDESAQRVLLVWLGLTWQGFVGAELSTVKRCDRSLFVPGEPVGVQICLVEGPGCRLLV